MAQFERSFHLAIFLPFQRGGPTEASRRKVRVIFLSIEIGRDDERGGKKLELVALMASDHATPRLNCTPLMPMIRIRLSAIALPSRLHLICLLWNANDLWAADRCEHGNLTGQLGQRISSRAKIGSQLSQIGHLIKSNNNVYFPSPVGHVNWLACCICCVSRATPTRSGIGRHFDKSGRFGWPTAAGGAIGPNESGKFVRGERETKRNGISPVSLNRCNLFNCCK